MGDVPLIDSMIHDGLLDAFEHVHMGITAENVADSTASLARIRTRSQPEPAEVRTRDRGGRLRGQIVPIEIPQKRGEPRVVDNDEYPRAGTTAEALARLRPLSTRQGTVTAGNASG